jgi:hypothetical protein
MSLIKIVDDNGLFIREEFPINISNYPYLTEIIQEAITKEDGTTDTIDIEKVVMQDIIDEEGEVIGQEPVISPFYISEPCPEGFYRPKWDGEKWIEGLSQEEIEAIRNVTPTQTTDEKLEELATNVNDALYAIMMLSIE